MHITGRVDAISEVNHKTGNGKNGNPYSFYQQTVAVSVGGEMFEIAFRSDNAPVGSALALYELDEAVRIKVTNPRLYNGKVSFDAVMA